MTCAPGEESDQPGNPPIQIRALTTCALWVAKVAQADLSLRESFWDFGVTGPFIGLLKKQSSMLTQTAGNQFSKDASFGKWECTDSAVNIQAWCSSLLWYKNLPAYSMSLLKYMHNLDNAKSNFTVYIYMRYWVLVSEKQKIVLFLLKTIQLRTRQLFFEDCFVQKITVRP